MKRHLFLAGLAAIVTLPFPQAALAQRAQYEALVATHAQTNGVPEALVHRAALVTPARRKACAIPTPISPTP
jgi:hypothetical protein